MKNNSLDQTFDLYVWFGFQIWFMPFYVLGKQDEWKEWVGSSLNGWKVMNICKN